jgi:hypothetical protein
MTNLTIMFDGIKTNISGIPVEEFYKNPLLSFFPHKDRRDIISQRAEFKGLDIRIYGNTTISIKGSLHKYHNEGEHNYNEFNLSQFMEVLHDLSESLGINPFLASLHNLEFGVNVVLPFNTKEFIQRIVSYKGKDFDKRTFKNDTLKIYDKGLQYNRPENILRFEIAVKRIQFFKDCKISIRTLSDLIKPNIYPMLKKVLEEVYNDLLVFDPSSLKYCNAKQERELLLKGNSPIYWVRLKKQNPENFKKKRARFRFLVSKYGIDNQKQIVFDLISGKNLTTLSSEDLANIDLFLSQFKEQTFPELTGCKTITLKQDVPRINSYSIGVNTGKQERKCSTCGRDISEQRKGSLYCSEKLYGNEVKKCRNDHSNPRNNYRKKEERLYSGILLFDVSKYKIQIDNQFNAF